MILCVNLNAAVDKTIVVKRFRLNQIHRPLEVLALPGGKGCNVARALQTLGATPTVTGWIGGYAGQLIESGLREEGIDTAFVTTGIESRTCLSILDESAGTMTEIYEHGSSIPPISVEELRALFTHIVRRYTLVTISGSVPPGVPVDFYAELISLARDAGIPALLDSSGEPLRAGLKAGPALLKPNRAEFEQLVGQEEMEQEALASAAGELAARTGTSVLLSLGSEGGLLAEGDRIWQAQPPAIAAISAVGSGDSLLAGVAYTWHEDLPPGEKLRHGVAAGTANALLLGAGRLRQSDFAEILGQVTLTHLQR